MSSADEKIQLEDSIIIFQNPDLYFFRSLSPNVYTPYSVKYRSVPYYIYKALLLLHIPLYKLFWKNWSRNLSSAKQVIIFDYGYQIGMEKYIRRKNPDCKISLFIWNTIDKDHHNYDAFTLIDRIFSSDPQDCRKYGFKHNTMFYLKNLRSESARNFKIENNGKLRIFFIGTDKNRGKYLARLKNIFTEAGLESDIRLLTDNDDPQYLSSVKDILTTEFLPYDKYLEEIRTSDIILDIVRDGQEAITMRVVESIFMNKKLITNNVSVKNLDFYNENNILILDADNKMPHIAELKAFIELPFMEYSKEVLDYYDVGQWLNRF